MHLMCPNMSENVRKCPEYVMQGLCEFFGKPFTPEIHRAALGLSPYHALLTLTAQVSCVLNLLCPSYVSNMSPICP